jgi:ankyrin repeat protein
LIVKAQTAGAAAMDAVCPRTPLLLFLICCLCLSADMTTRGLAAHLPPRPEDARLIAAVIAEDVPQTASLLDRGANPNARGTTSRVRRQDRVYGPSPTALIWAAEKGHAALVTLLLERHADINARGYDRDADIDGNSLIAATRKRHTDIVRLLLDHGANTEGRARDGDTALMLAAWHGDAQTVELLLDWKAKTAARDRVGDTALFLAAIADENHIETITLLVNHGADVNAANGDGRTPLMVAAASGHLDIVNLLLAHGANPNARSKVGITPLYMAVVSGRLEMVKRMLDAGARVASGRKTDVDALMEAFATRFDSHPDQRTEIARLLLDRSVDVNGRDVTGRTPLHAAALDAGPDAIRLLLARGAQVNARAKDGETPLLVAANIPQREVIQLLLDHGADVKAHDNHGNTALLAVVHGPPLDDAEMLKVLRLLLDHGAAVDERNPLGQTALMWVARYGTAAMARALLEHGATVNVKDNDGWPMLKWAAVDANADTIQALLAAGANANDRDREERTPLMEAAGGRWPVWKPFIDYGMAAAQHLLAGGADVNAADLHGETALMQAAESGTPETMRLLLSRGATVNLCDKNGWTAMTYAAGRAEIMALLRAAGAAEVVATPPQASTEPPIFFALKQIGPRIHLIGYAPGKTQPFAPISDRVLADLDREPVAGGKLENAALSPRGTWLALAINHWTESNLRKAIVTSRNLLVVRMSDLQIVYRMKDYDGWYSPGQLRWQDDNRLGFLRETQSADPKAGTSHSAFLLSGPHWMNTERPFPDRQDTDDPWELLLGKSELMRRQRGEKRLTGRGFLSMGGEGAESSFYLGESSGVIAPNGNTIATEARFAGHHSALIEARLIVSRACENWRIRELPLPVRARSVNRYWLWRNWLIVRSELLGPPEAMFGTIVAGTARLDLICLDDPSRTYRIAAELFVPTSETMRPASSR